MPNLEGPAEKQVNIDADLTALSGARLNLRTASETLGVKYQINVQGILINAGAVDAVAATVNGSLMGDTNNNYTDFTLVLNVVHPLRFKEIKAVDATGVIIVGN